MEHKDRSHHAWLLVPGLLLFATALVFKWEKWPAGTIMLISSGVISCAGALLHRYRRGPGVAGVVAGAAAFFVAYVVFRLLYWNGAVLIGIAALALCVWALVTARRQRLSVRVAPALAVVVFCCTISLMAVPVHALYHYMFFETPGAQRFMHSGVGHWYRYSWFLYQDGQYARSTAMIDSAMAEVTAYRARTGKDGEWLLVQLREVRSAIEARTWNEFRQLHSPYEAPR